MEETTPIAEMAGARRVALAGAGAAAVATTAMAAPDLPPVALRVEEGAILVVLMANTAATLAAAWEVVWATLQGGTAA